MSSWPKEGKPKAAGREPPDPSLATAENSSPSDTSVDQLILCLRDLSECDEIEPIACGALVVDRIECLVQILAAFFDIADRDDIHQAAERLALVQEWIKRETVVAAADPIFSPLRLAS
jgi:hypothetical protein